MSKDKKKYIRDKSAVKFLLDTVKLRNSIEIIEIEGSKDDIQASAKLFSMQIAELVYNDIMNRYKSLEIITGQSNHFTLVDKI